MSCRCPEAKNDILSPATVQTKRLQVAIEMVRTGSTIRKASAIQCIPRSTLHDNVAKTSSRSVFVSRRLGRLSSLSSIEEELFLTLLFRYADRGIPLRGRHAKEAIEIIVSRMTPGRRLSPQFNNGSPGFHFLRDFTRRHRTKIIFAKPLRQEALCFNAVNGDALTTHFAIIKK